MEEKVLSTKIYEVDQVDYTLEDVGEGAGVAYVKMKLYRGKRSCEPSYGILLFWSKRQ